MSLDHLFTVWVWTKWPTFFGRGMFKDQHVNKDSSQGNYLIESIPYFAVVVVAGCVGKMFLNGVVLAAPPTTALSTSTATAAWAGSARSTPFIIFTSSSEEIPVKLSSAKQWTFFTIFNLFIFEILISFFIYI